MDDAGSPPSDLAQRSVDVQTLLGMVERRSLTPDQFHSACANLFGGHGSERALSALSHR